LLMSTSVPLVNPDGPAANSSSVSVQNTPVSDCSATVSVGRYFYLARELRQPFCDTYGRLHQRAQLKSMFVSE